MCVCGVGRGEGWGGGRFWPIDFFLFFLFFFGGGGGGTKLL